MTEQKEFVGAYRSLAMIEGTGLGFFGLDRFLIAHFYSPATITDTSNHSTIKSEQMKIGIAKLITCVITITCVISIARATDLRDPMYLFPALFALVGSLWLLHDMLWVMFGIVFSYQQILQQDVSTWKHRDVAQAIVVLSSLLYTVLGMYIVYRARLTVCEAKKQSAAHPTATHPAADDTRIASAAAHERSTTHSFLDGLDNDFINATKWFTNKGTAPKIKAGETAWTSCDKKYWMGSGDRVCNDVFGKGAVYDNKVVDCGGSTSKYLCKNKDT